MRPRVTLGGLLRGMISPLGFWALAAFLVVLYGALHAAALRRYTAILSGAFPASDGEILLGVTYIVACFACVLAAPILALAGVLLYLLNWVVGRPRDVAARLTRH